ncbi:MAG TPA: glycogen debranching N-terminal domain-containing protein, partial [Polyangia bacterium]|nr:glycogen debranching N-terminal domain-containing protein [Polyangia bacterium]
MTDHLDHDDELLQHHDKFYIQATSSRTDDRTRVLKHGQMFAVFDRYGDVQPVGLGEQGIYFDGTRFLSRLELRVGGRRPLLLSSTVKKENDLLAVDLSNPDLKEAGGALTLARGELHVFRSTFLWNGVCYERLRVGSFSRERIAVDLRLDLDADFADIFEVRGTKRARRGRRFEDAVDGATLIFGYQGLDQVTRRTRISFDPPPQALSGRQARYRLELGPREAVTLLVAVACEVGSAPSKPATHEHALASLTTELASAAFSRCRLHATSDDL